jgi:hypothetical protein
VTQDAVFAREAVAETTPILNYSSLKQEPPRKLTLEESDGLVRVIFATPPNWTYFLPVVTCWMVAALQLAISILSVRNLWQVLTAVGPLRANATSLIWHFAWKRIAGDLPFALIWAAIGAYDL